MLDINPFLVWFGGVKTRCYTEAEIRHFSSSIQAVVQFYHQQNLQDAFWQPNIQNIERWWFPQQRQFLARLYTAIQQVEGEKTTLDLLKVAFCQQVIELSNAAFNHQSMSFKTDVLPQLFDTSDVFLHDFEQACAKILESIREPLIGHAQVFLRDSRNIGIKDDTYDLVITSPPYPNRMSYIRELRPYMYWLEFIHEAREAGELDWEAIGGTWGIATSRVGKWEGDVADIPFGDFPRILADIGQHSAVLSRYVHKYFDDINQHLTNLYSSVKRGGHVYYIVGNSKFYDTLLPVQDIYACLLHTAGFINVNIDVIRKRNSKKELYEYIVSAQK